MSSSHFAALAGWSIAACFAYASLRTPDAPAPSARAAEPGLVRFAPQAAQLSALRSAIVEEVPLPVAEPLNGRAVLNENATARISSPISGRVIRLRVQPGDRVTAGDVLLVMSAPDLAAAAADVEKARADELRKDRALERAQELFDGGVLPQKDLEAAQADVVQARAESRRAELRLRNLAPRSGVIADGFALRSPLSGVVIDRQVNPGSEVRPDQPQPLFVISDPQKLWAIVDLPERSLARVKPGNPAMVEADAFPGARFPATVEKIGEMVDPATRRVQLRCALPNPDLRLKPEMYLRVTLVADAGRRAPRIPNTALVTEGVKSFVFVERSPGEFVRRAVTLEFRDRDQSYVAQGLAAGEHVVVTGALLLNAELREGS